MKKIILSFSFFSLLFGCNQHENTATKMPVQTSFSKLMEGNRRFVDEKTLHPHQNQQSILKNQNNQHPFAVIITCSDSRVSPELIFDQGIGDLFVIRNAGNLISDIDMGSIEYAIEHLKTPFIGVLGHTECGAVTAYVEDENDNYKKHQNHIDDLIKTIAEEDEEKAIDKENHLLECINANINHSVELIKNNPIVKKHHTQIVAMRYDVHTGLVEQIK